MSWYKDTEDGKNQNADPSKQKHSMPSKKELGNKLKHIKDKIPDRNESQFHKDIRNNLKFITTKQVQDRIRQL